MKFLLIVLGLLAITGVSSQLVGTWLRDWRIQLPKCAATGFTISGSIPSGLTIAYSYSYNEIFNQTDCLDLNITTNFTSTLTLDANTGAYYDDRNQSLVYYPSNDTVLFYYNSPKFPNEFILYDKTGAYVSQELLEGVVSGFWFNPKPINSTNPTSCNLTIPANLSIQFYNKVWTIGVFENSTGDGHAFSLFFDQQNEPYWSDGILNNSQASFSYLLNSTTNQSTLIVEFYGFADDNTNQCYYSYERVVNFIAGTWKTDWQTEQYSNIPTSIQITNVSNTYMNIQSIFPTYSTNSVLTQLSPTGYLDINHTSYTYDQATNTISSTGGALYSEHVLFSPTGSLFNNSAFNGNWSYPQLVNNSDAEFCCVPEYIQIILTSTPNSPNVNYYFTQNGLIEGCTSNYQQNYGLGTTLSIETPSTSQLVYTMGNGAATFELTSNNNASNLTLNVNYNNECYFVMTPAPLSANIVSSKIIFVMFALLSIFLTM